MSALPRPLDELLADQIHQRTGHRIRDLTVRVNGETVVLSGRAASFYVKQLAQHGVREMLPQVVVRNAIEVS